MTDNNAESPNLMVIGCYRSNEVDDAHVRTILINSLREMSQQESCGCFNLTEIPIGNLAVPDINRLLAALLSADKSCVLGLAEICHKKTQGNTSFLLQFLSMLQDQLLLQLRATRSARTFGA